VNAIEGALTLITNLHRNPNANANANRYFKGLLQFLNDSMSARPEATSMSLMPETMSTGPDEAKHDDDAARPEETCMSAGPDKAKHDDDDARPEETCMSATPVEMSAGPDEAKHDDATPEDDGIIEVYALPKHAAVVSSPKVQMVSLPKPINDAQAKRQEELKKSLTQDEYDLKYGRYLRECSDFKTQLKEKLASEKALLAKNTATLDTEQFLSGMSSADSDLVMDWADPESPFSTPKKPAVSAASRPMSPVSRRVLGFPSSLGVFRVSRAATPDEIKLQRKRKQAEAKQQWLDAYNKRKKVQ
jgi:hypothetical protein